MIQDRSGRGYEQINTTSKKWAWYEHKYSQIDKLEKGNIREIRMNTRENWKQIRKFKDLE